MTDVPTDWRTGKICYLELPSADVEASANFYRAVFGWRIRRRSNGAVTFDDTVGGVSGTFVTGRPPTGDPGLVVYVMVADAGATLDALAAAGGQVVLRSPLDHAETFVWFRDPGGNLLGIYEQPGLAEKERS